MEMADKYFGEVAPYVGAWIETTDSRENRRVLKGRTLCGCVD